MMKNKKILLILFIIISLGQMFVPIKMILDNEDVLKNGIRYQFKIADLSPRNDVYGDFIKLKYEHSSILVSKDDWLQSEPAYVQLVVRADSFAEISSIQKTLPDQLKDYIYVKIVDIERLDTADKLMIEYPSINYFIEGIGNREQKKRIITHFFNDTINAKAIVFAKEGRLVLKEILIDEVPLSERMRLLEK